jgi:CheY-like chemotaxis protein
MSPSAERKKVAVFDPEERSGTLLGKLLEHLGYEVELHRTSKKVPRRTHGSKTVDLLIINLAVFGDTYQQVTEQMGKLQLNAKDAPPMIAVTTLRISQDARERLEQLGARAVFSQNAQLVELMFEVNRLLFPKIRELRRYTRVFGGFPVRFLQGGQWREGEVYNISQASGAVRATRPGCLHRGSGPRELGAQTRRRSGSAVPGGHGGKLPHPEPGREHFPGQIHRRASQRKRSASRIFFIFLLTWRVCSLTSFFTTSRTFLR